VRNSVRVGLACNNRCIFCSQEGLKDSPQADAEGEVTLVGGEPLLHELRSAKGVQTNGSKLAERAAELVGLGIRDVHVSIHGAEAAIHDYHTGREGSFQELMAGIAAARAEGMMVVAATVLTRSNFRGLDALARLVHSKGIVAWSMVVPHVAGRAEKSFDRVVPRLAMALPFALHAAALAQRLGLPVFLDGAPLCLLGPFAPLSLPPLARAYAEVCGSCPARESCPGVDGRYLSRFEGDELSAREAVTLSTHPLQELFVGAGELAAAAPVEKRLHLPVAGKVTPAAAEVSASAPKKTGEALREIFPALFEPMDNKD
jgi:hypothetical protein